jgi:arginyl-tRNA synthetase
VQPTPSTVVDLSDVRTIPINTWASGNAQSPMPDLAALIAARLQLGFDQFEPGADPVVRPSDRADFQVNGVLPLAKRLGQNPRPLAEQIVAAVELDDLCARVEIAGPGFLNLTVRDDALAAAVATISRNQRLGIPSVSQPEVIVVDYSAPNVAKEMHVGHLRSTIIGDALVRLLDFLGHTVIRENHIGDWGTPFGMLIEHLGDLGEQDGADELSMGDLSGFYRAARRKFDDDPTFADRARARVVALQAGDAETLRLWQTLVDESSDYFQSVYERLGVLLTPSDIRGESAYNAMLTGVLADLDELGLLVTSDGARCVFPPGFTNRENEPLPLIVRKADGGYGYAATDLATVRDRVDRLGATRLLYCVGLPQAQHLEMVWAVSEMAGWLRPPTVSVHVGNGNVLGADGKLLRTRAGTSLRLVDLLDEAVLRAGEILQARGDLPAEVDTAELAHQIGIGAVKYADLSTDRVRDYQFDWDRMLSFDGDTAPYLQYAHVRIRSIFRRAGISPSAVVGVQPTLREPAERALALKLLDFEPAITETVESLAPHRLCTYLYRLAGTFTTFYESCPVLKAPPDVRAERLLLCELTACTLRLGLGLLGIATPDQM